MAKPGRPRLLIGADHRLGAGLLVGSAGFVLNDLVHGVSSGQEELDGLIGPALSEDWTVDRLEALLRVILRAGTYELKIKKNIPAAVIISEYLDVAHAFFEGGETRMVNGVLDHLARDLRTGEL